MMRNKFFGLFWKVQEQRLSEETLSWNAVRDPPPQISSDTISGVDVKLSREHELTPETYPNLGKTELPDRSPISRSKASFYQDPGEREGTIKWNCPKTYKQMNWVLVLFGNNITCFKIMTSKYLDSNK